MRILVSVGPDVSAARAAAGLTLDDVAAATRVRTTVLEHIERDDFSLCGGDVYARGHLRAIGHALDADPEPWVAEYDREHAWSTVPTPVEVLEHGEVLAPRRGPNWTAAMAVALAGVVAVGVWSVVRPGDAATESSNNPPVAATAPSNGDGTQQSPSDDSDPNGSNSSADPNAVDPNGVDPNAVDPDAGAVAAVDNVTLNLSAPSGVSWVSVTRGSGEVLFQGLLEEGQSQTFDDDDELALVVGNGAAVALTVNGRDLGAPGGQGEVVRLSFGPGDPNAG